MSRRIDSLDVFDLCLELDLFAAGHVCEANGGRMNIDQQFVLPGAQPCISNAGNHAQIDAMVLGPVGLRSPGEKA